MCPLTALLAATTATAADYSSILAAEVPFVDPDGVQVIPGTQQLSCSGLGSARPLHGKRVHYHCIARPPSSAHHCQTLPCMHAGKFAIDAAMGSSHTLLPCSWQPCRSVHASTPAVAGTVGRWPTPIADGRRPALLLAHVRFSHLPQPQARQPPAPSHPTPWLAGACP